MKVYGTLAILLTICGVGYSYNSGQVGYNTHAAGPVNQGTATQQHGASGAQAGGATSGGSNLYPSIPNQANTGGNTNNRPAQYPQYPGYQQPQYPQGYPQGGQYQGQYPVYQGGYQGQYPGYQQPGGYQQPQGGYPGYNQGGYNPYGQQPPQKSSGSSFLSDQLTSSLKTIGTDLLKNAFSKILQNSLNPKSNNQQPQQG